MDQRVAVLNIISQMKEGFETHDILNQNSPDSRYKQEAKTEMAKAQRDSSLGPHQPTISHELALRRLQAYLEQIKNVRQDGIDSAMYSTWRTNVKMPCCKI